MALWSAAIHRRFRAPYCDCLTAMKAAMNRRTPKGYWPCVPCAVLVQPAVAAEGPCEFAREFAPAESIVKPQERPYREAVCLNGAGSSSPWPVPQDFRARRRRAARVAAAAGRSLGRNTDQDPVALERERVGQRAAPSARARSTPTGPIRSTIPATRPRGTRSRWAGCGGPSGVPAGWGERRIVLHFEAVAGDCQVLVNGQTVGPALRQVSALRARRHAPRAAGRRERAPRRRRAITGCSTTLSRKYSP